MKVTYRNHKITARATPIASNAMITIATPPEITEGMLLLPVTITEGMLLLPVTGKSVTGKSSIFSVSIPSVVDRNPTAKKIMVKNLIMIIIHLTNLNFSFAR